MKRAESRRAEELLARLNEPFWQAALHKPGQKTSASRAWFGDHRDPTATKIHIFGLTLRVRDMAVAGVFSLIFLTMTVWIFIYTKKVQDYNFSSRPTHAITTWGGTR